MDAGGDRFLQPSNVAVIREIYDSEFSRDDFEIELDRALDAGYAIIVIEPTQLGIETARWIKMGNFLHKSAVLSGLGAIAAGLFWKENPYMYAPMGVYSLLCTGLYTASWQFDNCVKYQVENNTQRITKLRILSAMSTSLPIVLVRKDDTLRKILHCSVTFLAASFCAYRLYRTLK